MFEELGVDFWFALYEEFYCNFLRTINKWINDAISYKIVYKIKWIFSSTSTSEDESRWSLNPERALKKISVEIPLWTTCLNVCNVIRMV